MNDRKLQNKFHKREKDKKNCEFGEHSKKIKIIQKTFRRNRQNNNCI